MKITIVSVSSPAITCAIKAYEEINKNEEKLELSLFYALGIPDDIKSEKISSTVSGSDVVFVDLMGSVPEYIDAVRKGLENCKGQIIPYGNSCREFLRLGNFTADSMGRKSDRKPSMEKMHQMQKMADKLGRIIPGKIRDMRNYSAICKYFHVADYSNILNMLYLIMREYGNIKGLPRPEPPREVPASAFTNPETGEIFDTPQQYREAMPFDESKPLMLFLYYGHIYPMDYSGAAAVLHRRFAEKFNVISVAISGTESFDRKKLSTEIKEIYNIKPHVVVNTMSFRLSAGPMGGNTREGTDFLKEIDVPYLHPVFMSRRSEEDWKNSVQGMTPSEVLISVMLPESDGALDIFPIGCMGKTVYHEKFDVTTEEIAVIDERLDKLVGCAEKYADLSLKLNKNKRVAVICYNYPPGEGNLFGGAFLDTLKSVSNIMKVLKDNGYTTEKMTSQEILDEFLKKNLVNTARYSDNTDSMIKYPRESYMKNFENMPDREDFINAWGNPSGTIMTDKNGDFNIPAVIKGNVLIGLQPSRGVHEDQEKLYHDKTLPPHHQYAAFYEYIRDVFKADAVIHVGTHGTLEFLKGKECGMSENCFPDRLIGDIPHIYLYYCGNAAECIIAKRRSHAQIVSYQPPVFVMSELYGDYLRLAELISNYHHALALSPVSADDILKDIAGEAQRLNLPTDMEELEDELYRMNKSLIPKGLHIFGQGYDSEEAETYVRGLLESSTALKSVREILAYDKGYDLEAQEQMHKYNIVDRFDKEANAEIDRFFENDLTYSGENEALRETFENAKRIYINSQENNEFKGLIHALNGGYTPAKSAGDIYRNPDVLPSGENLIQFDCRLVPTMTAFKRGHRIAENTIEAYKNENGTYPSSAAVVLWGLETSRTQGETFSQALSYLGIKLDRESSIWTPKFDIIPIRELKRPRIDVTVNICGFFRDMFPNLIENFDDILHKLYELDETPEQNYFKAHTDMIKEKLIEQGYSEKEALDLAVSRIFGPKEGEYGTGLTDIIETKNWQNEEDLGSQFLTSLKYVYTRNLHGADRKGLYENNLKSVDIVSQVRDNREYEITDLDHYYEFFGGLAKSVEIVKGRKASMLITDTTGDRIITESVEKSINRGIRTRVLNPKWIDGMLEHEYHGAQVIAQRFENIMGLAATTGSVEKWIYDDLYRTYAEDEKMRERVRSNNVYAYMNILEQMIEYSKRGYWKASEEQLDVIRQAYLETEGMIEEKTENIN